jgi:hypothetical protein
MPVIGAALGGVKARINGAIAAAAWSVAAGSAALLCAVFLFAAAFIWLASRYDAISACLAFAGLFAVIAIIAVLVRIVFKARAKREAQRQKELWAAQMALAGTLASQVVRKVPARYLLLGAVAAGFLLTNGFERSKK